MKIISSNMYKTGRASRDRFSSLDYQVKCYFPTILKLGSVSLCSSTRILSFKCAIIRINCSICSSIRTRCSGIAFILGEFLSFGFKKNCVLTIGAVYRESKLHNRQFFMLLFRENEVFFCL